MRLFQENQIVNNFRMLNLRDKYNKEEKHKINTHKDKTESVRFSYSNVKENHFMTH